MSDQNPEYFELKLTIKTPNGIVNSVTRYVDPKVIGRSRLPLSFLVHEVEGMTYRLEDALRKDAAARVALNLPPIPKADNDG